MADYIFYIHLIEKAYAYYIFVFWLKICGFEFIGSQNLNESPLSCRWEAGPKPIDGIWAPWWYGSVHKSTSFKTEHRYPKVGFLYHY